MATGNIVTTEGKKIVLNRTFLASPTKTAPSLFKVGTGNNTPVAGDTDLQTAVVISGGSYTKAIASGYPLLTESTLNSTIRAILLTTEANGNTLAEFGSFNNDTSKVLFSRAVYTGIIKTSSIQMIFVEKDKIV